MVKLATKVFKALADDTRLRILRLFLDTDDPLCVCEMVAALNMPQYHISKHLLILKNAGLVDNAKRGTWAYYSLSPEQTRNRQLFAFLKAYLKSGDFDQDREKLRLRLLLRDQGKCTVGTLPERQLNRLIRTRLRKAETAGRDHESG